MADNRRLFILSPTNTGSSFLVYSLINCANTVSLPGVYASEAALLPNSRDFDIPKNVNQVDRYSFNVKIMSKAVEHVWKSNKNYAATNRVLIEKSPGFDIFAAQEFDQWFPEPDFIILMRNPYAYVEGVKRRNNDCTTHRTHLAIDYWLKCARQQVKNYEVLESRILFTYESMCDNSEEIEELVRDYMSPLLDDFSLQNELKIDNVTQEKRPRPITNFNELQISKLSKSDVELIKNKLKDSKDILEFFNYD